VRLSLNFIKNIFLQNFAINKSKSLMFLVMIRGVSIIQLYGHLIKYNA